MEEVHLLVAVEVQGRIAVGERAQAKSRVIEK